MRFIAALAMCACLSLYACAPDNGTGVRTGIITDQRDWPFWPAQMRIYPVVRIVNDLETGQVVIEARIEFKDQDGAVTKAIGELTVELYAAMESRTSHLIDQWSLDLRDLAINRQHFDDVTRTYLLRMEIDPSRVPERGELRAAFASIDGRLFEHDRSFRR